MSKHSDNPENRLIEAAKIKNEYIETLKDQIQMLQEQLKNLQVQSESSQYRLMNMFEQTQRLFETD